MSWRGPSAVQGSPANVWQFPGLWMGGCRCPTARVCPMLFTAACGAGLISSPITSWSRWSAVSSHLAPSRKRCALTPITTAGWRLQVSFLPDVIPCFKSWGTVSQLMRSDGASARQKDPTPNTTERKEEGKVQFWGSNPNFCFCSQKNLERR